MLDIGAVDKIDIRARAGVRLANPVADLLRRDPGISMVGNKYYQIVVNLQLIGLSSVLYFGYRRNGSHKLQIVNPDSMPFSRILHEITRVFDLDPLHAELMRVDLAVDVVGYTVSWFRQNAWVMRKQSTSDYGTRNWRRERVETLYFGKGANTFCMYDKTAERAVRYARSARRGCNGAMPSFEAVYGRPADEILTRVERRYGAGKIPKTICTMGEMKKNAVDLNPYEPLRFSEIILSDESLEELSGDQFLKAQGFLRLTERYGLHAAKQLLDKKSSRNTNRLLAQFHKLRHIDKSSTPPDLYSIYKKAISRQLST